MRGLSERHDWNLGNVLSHRNSSASNFYASNVMDWIEVIKHRFTTFLNGKISTESAGNDSSETSNFKISWCIYLTEWQVCAPLQKSWLRPWRRKSVHHVQSNPVITDAIGSSVHKAGIDYGNSGRDKRIEIEWQHLRDRWLLFMKYMIITGHGLSDTSSSFTNDQYYSLNFSDAIQTHLSTLMVLNWSLFCLHLGVFFRWYSSLCYLENWKTSSRYWQWKNILKLNPFQASGNIY